MHQGRVILETFKEGFSPLLFQTLENPMALTLIANGQIDLQQVDNCYTFFYLFNPQGYQCLQQKRITFADFLAIPVNERYTLQHAWEHLNAGKMQLTDFLKIPEKKRIGLTLVSA